MAIQQESNFGNDKGWNERAHKVSLVMHTPHGTVAMKDQIMTGNQVNGFKADLKSKLHNPHGEVEVNAEDGIIIVPHEVLVNSVMQLYIDREIPKAPEPQIEEAPKKKRGRKPKSLQPDNAA